MKKDKVLELFGGISEFVYKKEFIQYVSLDSGAYKRKTINSNSCRVTSLKNKN